MNALLKVALGIAAVEIKSTRAFQPADLARTMSVAETWIVLPNFDHFR